MGYTVGWLRNTRIRQGVSSDTGTERESRDGTSSDWVFFPLNTKDDQVFLQIHA